VSWTSKNHLSPSLVSLTSTDKPKIIVLFLLITSWIIWTHTILVGIPTVREHRDPGKRYNRLTTRSQLWLDPKRWCPKWTYIYAFIWVWLASQGICIGTYGSKDHTIVTCISSQDSLRLTWSTRFSHLCREPIPKYRQRCVKLVTPGEGGIGHAHV
jgi:hypothetical protein